MIEKLTPIIQALAWPLFALVAALMSRKGLVTLLESLSKRMRDGSDIKVGDLLHLGGGVRPTESTEDVKDEADIRGDPDQFKLLFSATAKSRRWKKSTKAMPVPGGCVVQVSTEYVNQDGTRSVAEALTFVPNVEVLRDKKAGGRLVSPSNAK
jgi:hypothetical protein